MKKWTLLPIALLALWLAPHSLAQTAEEVVDPPPGEWPTFGGTADAQRFSPLTEITPENVDDLDLVWSRNLDFEGSVQSTPVVWDGTMYINGIGAVLALDATTGDLLWEYRYEIPEEVRPFYATRMRGGVVVYDGKVFHATNTAKLVALEAETGEELWSTPLGDMAAWEAFTAGPIFADGKIIVGPTGGDASGHPGRVIALDSEKGEVQWVFNVIPRPGEPGFETWDPPSSAEWGAGAVWNVGAYDVVNNNVIYGTGNPTPWDRFDRRFNEGEPSADLYTASWVALDAETGELEWYHQVVPGDEWDYDQQATPVLADLEIEGEERRVAILSTTTGYLVLLDAATGEFITAHQMHPDVTVHLGYEEDGTPIINDEMRFDTPGEFKTITPGLRWASFELGAYSPDTGLYYRPNEFISQDLALFPLPEDWEPMTQDAAYRRESTRTDEHYFDRLGAVSAIDPLTGEVVWEFSHGYGQRGGVVATAGGLVFGAFEDRVFRAFDAETGDVLWDQVLTAMMRSNPISYAVDGKQYVAVLVGEGAASSGLPGLPQTVPGPAAAFVFALP